MAARTVILDWQHQGKPDGDDQGAGADQNADGSVDAFEREITPTGLYGMAIDVALRQRGHRVAWFGDGRHGDRNARAVQLWPSCDLYVALHTNSGGGNYGAVFHDHRSSRGKVAAGAIAGELAASYPPPVLSRVLIEPTGPDTPFPRPYYCIAGVYAHKRACAVVLEPFFLDNPGHRRAMLEPEGLHWWGVDHQPASGLARLGSALARGIASYLEALP